MAMIAPMKNVPQNSGIEPNAPDEPAWSARIAVCGLHSMPNRKSVGRTQLEEAQAFEQQRQDDAERRQDRDQRGGEQQDHHPALDPGARAELRRDCGGAREPRAASATSSAIAATDHGVTRLALA